MADNLELPSMMNPFQTNEAGRGESKTFRALNSATVSQAVVSATDWTTETIINQNNKGNIALIRNFSGRDAWDAHRKSRFIESLILGLPVPQLVLAASHERKGAYIVIDGKQRLLSYKAVCGRGERLRVHTSPPCRS